MAGQSQDSGEMTSQAIGVRSRGERTGWRAGSGALCQGGHDVVGASARREGAEESVQRAACSPEDTSPSGRPDPLRPSPVIPVQTHRPPGSSPNFPPFKI